MTKSFLQLGAHLNPIVSLVIVQETRNKLCWQFVSCSVHPLECVGMTRVKIQRDYKHCGWSVILFSRILSRTFAFISRVVRVDGRPECLRPFTDSGPIFKLFNHSNILAWLKACSPKASFSIRWASAAVLFNLKQNLMQILCSLTSAISKLSDKHANGVKKTAKSRKHVHLKRRELAD